MEQNTPVTTTTPPEKPSKTFVRHTNLGHSSQTGQTEPRFTTYDTVHTGPTRPKTHPNPDCSRPRRHLRERHHPNRQWALSGVRPHQQTHSQTHLRQHSRKPFLFSDLL